MLVLIIITILLVLLISFLLITPATLVLNTWSDTFKVSFSPLFRIWLDSRDNFRPKMTLFFFTRRLGGQQKKLEHTSTRKSKRHNIHRMLRLVKAIIKSIRIKKFFISMDTEDYPLNAFLIPLIQIVNSKNKYMQVNFQGENQTDIWITVRIYKIIIEYFKSTKIKNHGKQW